MICDEKRQQVQQILQLLQLTREVGKLKGTAKTVQHAMRYFFFLHGTLSSYTMVLTPSWLFGVLSLKPDRGLFAYKGVIPLSVLLVSYISV